LVSRKILLPTFAHILVYTWCTNIFYSGQSMSWLWMEITFHVSPFMSFRFSHLVITPRAIKLWYSAEIPKISKSLSICVGLCFVSPKHETGGTKWRLRKLFSESLSKSLNFHYYRHSLLLKYILQVCCYSRIFSKESQEKLALIFEV